MIRLHPPMTMTDADRLLREYIARFESGGSVDPSDLLEQADGRERARLSALIDGYLEHGAPAKQWNPEAFEGSLAERATELVQDSWEAGEEALPRQLVALRNKAKLKRTELFKRLAEALGHPDQEPKVARYYNAIEHGALPTEGISSKVFDALAKILDTSAEALRKAGEAVTPSAGGEPGPAYARMAPSPGRDESPGYEQRSGPQERPDEIPAEEEWDEVDRLFRGSD